jgi:hemoglobin
MSLRMLLRRWTVALGLGLFVCAAQAQATAPADDSLYREFGGKRGITVLVDDFLRRLLADRRMNPFFKDADRPRFKEQIAIQFCQVSGGPCALEKPDMKKPHSGFDITHGDFNALVEVLQASMDAQGITFASQNRLLAKLAPMHRDIVNTPAP